MTTEPRDGVDVEGARTSALTVCAVSMPAAVGIDVGATKIVGGLIAVDGQVLARDALKLTAATVASGLARPLADLIETLRLKPIEPYEVVAVGVGTAGLVRWPEGEVEFAANHGHRRLKLRDRLAERCNLPVVVDNDANVAALAEAAPRRNEGMLFLAVGTGLGSGFVVNGEIFRGHNGRGAEIGHVVIEQDRPLKCACGRSGCLETLASGRALTQLGQTNIDTNPDGALAQFLKRRNVSVSTKSMIDAALVGIPVVEYMVASMGECIGSAIGRSALALLPVDRIVIGGGLSILSDLLTIPIHRACQKALYGSKYLSAPTVSCSLFGAESTMIGAGLLAHHQFAGCEIDPSY